MKNEAEQALVDALYAALDQSSVAGVSLQAAWGHLHSVGLHLEYKLLQGVKATEAEQPVFPQKQPSPSAAVEGSKERK